MAKISFNDGPSIFGPVELDDYVEPPEFDTIGEAIAWRRQRIAEIEREEAEKKAAGGPQGGGSAEGLIGDGYNVRRS
jgi:hypothetical protein